MNILISLHNYNNSAIANKKPDQPICFTSNPNSALLKFCYNDFFVNIKGYGKNISWAEKVKTIADSAVNKIKTTDNSDEVLPSIAFGIRNANQECLYLKKKRHSGLLRTFRKGYGNPGTWQGQELVTPIKEIYESYYNRLKPITYNPLKNPYNDISLTTVETDKFFENINLLHGSDDCINNALDRVGEMYSNLHKNFISKPKNVTDKNLDKINSDVAEIRWIMAHSMPWERGSDAISNVFMRSLYKSMGIKTYPLKQGISLDLEAFCTPLDEYKKNFAAYFSQYPKIIN